jgi:hypothetical protein
VYAGAAREAVFANAEVMRRIKDEFVPLALRAPLVNAPQSVGDPDERWLYERINRAKIAPQGICVLNSAGQVLAWVQMFDDDKSVQDFLDHAVARFRENADPRQHVVTERFMHFPSDRTGDGRDDAKLPAVIADGHAPGKKCPAAGGKGQMTPGSVVARLVGRALDAQVKPVADTVKQEHYVEDQFGIAPEMQHEVTRLLASSRDERVRLPESFAKICAAHAHLGHIDVQPCICMIKGQAENKGEWRRCELWARKTASGWHIDGESEVVSQLAINGDGVHNVKLAWEGFLETSGNQISRFVLAGRGTEKLQFANNDNSRRKNDEVSFLPAGRPIDIECGVRYGIIAETIVPNEAGAGAVNGNASAAQIPEEAKRHIVEALGPPFLVFRDKVQGELQLTAEQKQKLEERLREIVQDAMQFFQKLQDAKPEERQNEHHQYQRKAQERLSTFLKDVLQDEQNKRLRQLMLQREGGFAFGNDEISQALSLTNEQRKQFMTLVQEMEGKIRPLLQEAQTKGNPEEIRPKAMKIRDEYEKKIAALLTVEQKKQWQEMLGKPFDLGD